MDFPTAQALFAAAVAARGWSVAAEGPAVMVWSGDDCLRLRPAESGVALEVTHGPGDGPPAGWLDLYSDPPAPGTPALAECVAYGLDLMRAPPPQHPDAEPGAAADGGGT